LDSSEPSTFNLQHATSQRFVSNLVVMGMGEPLANYDALMKALKIVNAPWGGGIGARKITISTSGLAPQIRRLADEPLQFRIDSKLLIVSGAPNEKNEGLYYYKWDKRRFVLLARTSFNK